MEFYINGLGEEMDKDKFMSLQSLMKRNDGLWKSEKQGKFILGKWTKDEEFVKDSWINNLIDVQEGCKYVVVEGFVSFSHGHGKGHRPLTYCYEVDYAGVKRRFRSHYGGNMVDGSYLKSMELDWERTVEVPEAPKAPEVAPEPEEKTPVSEYFGEVGKRYNGLKLTVTFTTGFDTMYGYSYLNKMVDANGNVFVWFTGSWCLEVGTTYTMNATVKDHSEYGDTKQTVLTRCMKVEEVKEVA